MTRKTPLVRLLLTSLGLCWTGVSFADNPIVQTKYTADPAPMVYKDTVYLYTSHDEDTSTALGNFNMYNWMLYTSTDMANWTDHGIIAGTKAPNKTFTWAADNGAWAPQVIERNGKFYLYAPIRANTGSMTIAVAVADSPFGPFKDALNKGLVSTGTSDDIDPSAFIDNDGQAYLYWGNPNCYYIKLNEDMISTSGTPTKIAKLQTYQEGPWFYRRGDNYYLAFSSTCCPEGIGYAMSTSPTGPWTYKNSIMDGNSQANGNHPGIIDFKGNSYVFGFNWRLQEKRTGARNKEMRSVSVEKFSYKADGTIPKLPFWSETGPEQIGTLDPYLKTEAETMAWGWDVRTETCSEGGMDVTEIQSGDYIKVKGVDFGGGATSLDVRVASAGSGGDIEVRLESKTGTLLGTCAVAGTGGAQTWATKTCPISGASGVHDLFFVFTGSGTGSLFNFNWWKFSGAPSDGGAAGQGGSDAGVSTGGTSGSGTGGTGGTVTSGASGKGGTGGSNAGGQNSGTGGATGGKGGATTGGNTSSKAGSSGGSGGTTSAGGSSSSKGGQSSGNGPGGTSAGAGGSSVSSSSVAQGGNTGSGGASSKTTSSENVKSSSSGCSCELGRSPKGYGGILGLGLALGLFLLRRRRHPRA
jgi:arabinoxylan arabinofuranohydrolase